MNRWTGYGYCLWGLISRCVFNRHIDIFSVCQCI